MSEPFIGEIRTFPYTYTPAGWMECSGQYLQIGQFSALFAIIGTLYGGNGRTNFRLPPMNSMAVMGNGTGPGLPLSRQGFAYGAERITLNTHDLPEHDHTAMAEVDLSDSGTAAGCFVSIFQNPQGAGVMAYTTDQTPSKFVPMSAAQMATAGGGQSHYNMQPYLPLRFCIAITGIFPSRN